jgi:hypothetical protein
VKVRLADVVELPIYGALEQRKARLDRVRVVEAASADVFLG